MIKDLKELAVFARTNFRDPDKADWTIKFDLPEHGFARMHILRCGETVEVINALTWVETFLIRRLVKFGDNHTTVPTTWDQLSNYLLFLSYTLKEEREDAEADAVWRLQHQEQEIE